LNKAYALIIEGKYEEALTIYDSIINENPFNVEALLRKGICLYYLGRRNNSSEFHEESIKMYDKVLKLEPKNKRALHMKGVAYFYLGKMALANEYYDKVLEIDPNFGISLYNKACNLSRSGNTKEALDYLQRAVISNKRFKQWAHNEEAFKVLRGNPQFEKMVKFDFDIDGST
jgi:tetratricopeptide (TPR) repeat protein